MNKHTLYSIISLLLLLFINQNTVADNLSDSNQLFDFAESNYSQYFSPPGALTKDAYGYYYRYYTETNTYLGTQQNNVFVLGEAFGEGVIKVGVISDFVTISNVSSESVEFGTGPSCSVPFSQQPNPNRKICTELLSVSRDDQTYPVMCAEVDMQWNSNGCPVDNTLKAKCLVKDSEGEFVHYYYDITGYVGTGETGSFNDAAKYNCDGNSGVFQSL